ncbi:MAG: putative bifunctional diguanylate cyclase/phosphodiesterase [Candidatus Melainabacteria bacterium]
MILENAMLGWIAFGLALGMFAMQLAYSIRLNHTLTRQTDAQQLLSRQLEYQSLFDPVTQLPNRRLFQDRLTAAIKRSDRDQQPFGVMMIDLRRFKEINESLGHVAGDYLLQEVAGRFRSITRESETLARMGGDEFAIIFQGGDSPKAIHSLVERLHTALEKPIALEGVFYTVDATMGVSLYPEHGRDPDLLLRRADIAMNRARQHKSHFAIFDHLNDERSSERLVIEMELRDALKNNEIIPFYQPKIECNSRMIQGVEALARWMHPQRGLIAPDKFIPVAEQTGLIKELTMVMLRKSIEQASEWYRNGARISVSINITAESLEDQTFVDALWQILSEYRFPPQLLELEITEDAIINDLGKASDTTRKLTDMGIALSIDDFGTGNTSIFYLKKLPVTHLKIDRSFIRDMLQNADDAAIVRSTISLGKNMGLHVVAEGIEDAATFDELTGLGCDLAQGFYMSKPIPAEEMTAWLKSSAWGLRHSGHGYDRNIS